MKNFKNYTKIGRYYKIDLKKCSLVQLIEYLCNFVKLKKYKYSSSR